MRRAPLLLLALVTGACRLPNPDHCVHKDVGSDAWCAAHSPERPYCSPCAAEAHGCVAAPPTAEACPAYEPDDPEDTDDSPTSTGTG